jgi:hypothetical protein
MSGRWQRSKLNQGQTWDELEPVEGRRLSPDEVRRKRLDLAGDMLDLIISDDADDLGLRARRELERLVQGILGVRRYF